MAHRGILASWKEIAACLGVSARTAQRWEKTCGLPVYHQGEGRKSRIFAHEHELLQWRARGARLASEAPALEDSVPPPPDEPQDNQSLQHAPPGTECPDRSGGDRAERSFSRLLSSRTARVTLVVVAAAAVLVLWGNARLADPGTPASVTFKDHTLAVFDARGKLCWEKHFPGSVPGPGENAEPAALLDADGDGDFEILFSYEPLQRAQQPGFLYCYDGAGNLKWRHRYGAPKTFGNRVFQPNYIGRLVRLATANGRRYLISVALHHLWYPSVVALLDPVTGRVLEEYWHPGAVHHLVIQDLDGDRQPEVLLGAINNPGEGLGHPALIVLTLPFSRAPRTSDPSSMRFPPLTGGGESAYLLFPCPDVNRALGVFPFVRQLAVDDQGRILVQVQLPELGAVAYYLSPQLEVLECRPSDNLEPLHRRLQLQGFFNHPFTPAERAALCRVARFPAAPDGNHPGLAAFWSFSAPSQ
jgi:hypothetical protein